MFERMHPSKRKRNAKRDPLVDKHGGPTFAQLVIIPGKRDGEHILVFDGGFHNIRDQSILKEKHTITSLVRRIRGLNLNTFCKREADARRASDSTAL